VKTQVKLKGTNLMLIGSVLYIISGVVFTIAMVMQLMDFLNDEPFLFGWSGWIALFIAYGAVMIILGIVGFLRRFAFTGMKPLFFISGTHAFLGLVGMLLNPITAVIAVPPAVVLCIGAFKNIS